MDRISSGIRLVLWLLVIVALALVVAQYAGIVISVLLAALFMLAILRLAFPPRRR